MTSPPDSTPGTGTGTGTDPSESADPSDLPATSGPARPASSTAPAGPARSGLGLLAVLLPAVVVTVVASAMVNLLLPTIGDQFHASEAQLAWVVTGFMLMFAIGVPFYGRISDRIGLRRLFGFALVTYAVGSLLCALAPNLPALVAGRIVTGVGAAAIPVLSVVAVARLVAPERRGFAFGVLSAASGVGTAAGPALGGGLGHWLGWPSVFWVTSAAALALLPAALRVLPSEPPARTERFDLLGGVFLGLGAGLVLYGITQTQVAGPAAPSSWGSLAVAVLALALFAWRTTAADRPFVPPALFGNRPYRTAVAVAFVAMFVNTSAFVFVPLLLVDVEGLSPGAGALVMVPAGLAVALISPLVGRLVDRVGSRALVLPGLLTMAVFAAYLSGFAGAGSVFAAGAGILGFALGFICVLTPLVSTAASSLPAEQAGIGLGILQGAQFLGGGAGPALLGVLVASRQQADAEAVNPLYDGTAGAAYSDAFLLMAVLVLVTTVLAVRGLRSSATGSGTGH